MIKIVLFIVTFLCGQVSFAQKNSKIDTSNYYSYFSPKNLKGHGLTTNWLRLDDVVPIMLDELKKAGYDWLYDRTIYKLENGQHINISAYSRKNNIGFLYIEGHEIFPNKTHRNILFHTDNSEDDKFLVTKEIAINILRQDLRRYLATAPKPEQ